MVLIPTLRLAARSICILSVIAMGGCASSDPNGDFFSRVFGPHPVETAPADAKPARPHTAAAVAPAPAAAEADAKKRPPAAKRPGPAPAEPERQAAAMPAPADVNPPPLKLVGLTQAETVAQLGAPSAQWDRPPAKVWHYQGPDCALDVFFYLDVSRNEFSALRYTAAGADATATTGQTCLNRIRDVAQRK
jgi:hypothetical protein